MEKVNICVYIMVAAHLSSICLAHPLFISSVDILMGTWVSLVPSKGPNQGMAY